MFVIHCYKMFVMMILKTSLLLSSNLLGSWTTLLSYLLVNLFRSCSSVSSIANLAMSNRGDHFQRKSRTVKRNVKIKSNNGVEKCFQSSWNKKENWENNFTTKKTIGNTFEHVSIISRESVEFRFLLLVFVQKICRFRMDFPLFGDEQNKSSW